MIELYLREADPPKVIDCSGGQPDLVPEWVPWMMESLRERDLANRVYLWSDDNLSNDYFWRYLSADHRNLISGYTNYGRVCCFKGFNSDSFTFNTKADPSLFDGQFELFARLMSLGIDLYAYATFTALTDRNLALDMAAFVDRLQEVDSNLPLRLVPLRIESFGVVRERVGESQQLAMRIQDDAVELWNDELERRFTPEERAVPMPLVPLAGA